MVKLSKNRKISLEKIDVEKSYSLDEHEEKLSFKVKKRSQSPSVSGKVKM